MPVRLGLQPEGVLGVQRQVRVAIRQAGHLSEPTDLFKPHAEVPTHVNLEELVQQSHLSTLSCRGCIQAEQTLCPRLLLSAVSVMCTPTFSCFSRWICSGAAPKWLCSASSCWVAACVSSDVIMASGTGRPVPRPAACALASTASMFSMYSCALHGAISLSQSAG